MHGFWLSALIPLLPKRPHQILLLKALRLTAALLLHEAITYIGRGAGYVQYIRVSQNL